MRRAITALVLTLLIAGLVRGEAFAGDTACSTVKIEILQELTLERIAFDAKLKVTNNMPDKSLEELRVDIIIRDDLGNEMNDLFFIRPPECTGMTDVAGTGTVPASTVGEAHWLVKGRLLQRQINGA